MMLIIWYSSTSRAATSVVGSDERAGPSHAPQLPWLPKRKEMGTAFRRVDKSELPIPAAGEGHLA